MSAKQSREVLDDVAREAETFSTAIMDAVMSPLVVADNIGDVEAAMPGALADVFTLVAEKWRADAEERVRLHKQGAKGLQVKVVYAASLLAGIAVNLRGHDPSALGRESAEGFVRMSGVELVDTPARVDPDLVSCEAPKRCGVAHVFMEGACTLLAGHAGQHHAEELGSWTSPPYRGCAVEACGGSRLDPCRDSIAYGDARHSGDLARPGLDEQCRGVNGNDEDRECLLIAFHKGNHSDGVSGWAPHPVDADCLCDGKCPHCVMMGCEACNDGYAGDHGVRDPAPEATARQMIHPGAVMMLDEIGNFSAPDGPGLTREEARADNERRPELDAARLAGKLRATGAFSESVIADVIAETGLPHVVSADPEVPPPPVIVSAAASIIVYEPRDPGGMDDVGGPPFPGEPGYCAGCDALGGGPCTAHVLAIEAADRGRCEPCDLGGHTCQGCGVSTEHETPYACPDESCPGHPDYDRAACPAELNDGHASHPCTLPRGHAGASHDFGRDGLASGGIALGAGARIGETVEVAGTTFTRIGNDPFPPPPADGLAIKADGVRVVLLGNDGEVKPVPPPVVVPLAYSPKVLDVRRLTWEELSPPPALAETMRPAHRSVSQVETYEGCGMKYRLQRYGEAVNVPSWSLVGGLVVHQVFERMETAGWNKLNAEIWPVVFEEIVSAHEAKSGISRDLWIAADGGKENGEWWLVEGEKMSQTYRLWRKKMISDGWKITAVEHEINTPEEWAGVPVKGFLDLVLWHEATGTVLLPDAKSGRNKPGSRFQIDTYGRALRALGVPGVDMNKIKKIEAGYLMLRRGELIERHDVIEQGASGEEIEARFSGMDRAERAGVYLPNPSALCGACGVRAGCPVGRPAVSS